MRLQSFHKVLRWNIMIWHNLANLFVETQSRAKNNNLEGNMLNAHTF